MCYTPFLCLPFCRSPRRSAPAPIPFSCTSGLDPSLSHDLLISFSSYTSRLIHISRCCFPLTSPCLFLFPFPFQGPARCPAFPRLLSVPCCFPVSSPAASLSAPCRLPASPSAFPLPTHAIHKLSRRHSCICAILFTNSVIICSGLLLRLAFTACFYSSPVQPAFAAYLCRIPLLLTCPACLCACHCWLIHALSEEGP